MIGQPSSVKLLLYEDRGLPVITLGIRYQKSFTVVSRYRNACSFTCVCIHLRPRLRCFTISVTSSFRLSICFSAGECPGVEGEEITQHAQAEFSRTKTIWVKVTQ